MSGPKRLSLSGSLWKKLLPFQINSMTAVIRTVSTIASRRALRNVVFALLVTQGFPPPPMAMRTMRERLIKPSPKRRNAGKGDGADGGI